MANGNTNPGIGENADSGVMHNSLAARACARTRTRVENPAAYFKAWRIAKWGGDFDPVREAVEDAVAEFSDRQPARDRSGSRSPTRLATRHSETCISNSAQSCESTSCAIPPPRSRTASAATPNTHLPSHHGVRGTAPSVPRRKAVWHEPSQNNGLCCRCRRFSRAYSCRPSRY